jgi:hypothetical protein
MQSARRPIIRIAIGAAAAMAGSSYDVRALDVTNPLSDPGIRAVIDARQAAKQARGATPSIALDIRVTSDTTLAGCATAGSVIYVALGTAVQYCYFVQNTGDTPLSVHDIVSEHFGPVEMGLNQVLGVGATTLVRKVVATPTLGTQFNRATWYARESVPAYDQIEGTCSFPNIATTGTAMNLGDDERVIIDLPETMQIYGVRTFELSVHNNGHVSYPTAPATGTATNAPFPRAVPALTLAPYWDDLDSETGAVYRGQFVFAQAPANAYYVIQYHQRSHFPGPSPSTATFALGMLRSGQGLDGYVFFCYQDTNFGVPELNYGASATVGVNRDAGAAVQFSFNTPNQARFGGPNTGLGYIPTDTGLVAYATDTAIVFVRTDLIFSNGFQL